MYDRSRQSSSAASLHVGESFQSLVRDVNKANIAGALAGPKIKLGHCRSALQVMVIIMLNSSIKFSMGPLTVSTSWLTQP